MWRFSNQKSHSNCLWKSALSPAADTNVKSSWGDRTSAIWSCYLQHGGRGRGTFVICYESTCYLYLPKRSNGVKLKVKLHNVLSTKLKCFMISGTASLSLAWTTISLSTFMRVPSHSVPYLKMKIYLSHFQLCITCTATPLCTQNWKRWMMVENHPLRWASLHVR